MIGKIALLALLAQSAAGQPLPVPQSTAPATVEGVVVKFGTREPIAGARVQLDLQVDPLRDSQPPPGSPPPVIPPPVHIAATTGVDGKFVLDNVTPGEYRLYAFRNGSGYVPGEYGQRSPTGRGISFELKAGQKIADVQLALTPTGTIAGRAYDRDGEPAGHAVVQALRPVYRDGNRSLTIVQAVLTNDRGEYRLFWLPPGQYYVSAKAGLGATSPARPSGREPFGAMFSPVRITEPARVVTFEEASSPVVLSRTLATGEVVEELQVPVYYPGTTDAAGATRIDLRSGGSADGIDISVAAGSIRTHRVRGIVTANGQSVAGAQVLAIPHTSDPSIVIASDRSNPDGTFEISGVVPGSYFVFADNRGMTGGVAIQVGDANVDNVAIAVTSGFRLSGRIIVDGRSRTGGDPNVANLRVTLRRDPDILGMPSAGPSFSPPPAADGSFVLEGVASGDFRVTLGRPGPSPSLPQDAYIKSMRMGTADVLENGLHLSSQPRDPLEIVIGANGGSITGMVVNTRREPVPGIAVVVVPDLPDRSKSDRYKRVSSDGSGRFRVQDLAPGDYTLFAWEDIEEGAWHDPDVIRAYEGRGTSVRIREGSDESVQLTAIAVR